MSCRLLTTAPIHAHTPTGNVCIQLLTFYVSFFISVKQDEGAQLGMQVHKSFTLRNGLFAKALCYLGTREAQSPKCLMLCSLAICHCFTASNVCVITPWCIGCFP